MHSTSIAHIGWFYGIYRSLFVLLLKTMNDWSWTRTRKSNNKVDKYYVEVPKKTFFAKKLKEELFFIKNQPKIRYWHCFWHFGRFSAPWDSKSTILVKSRPSRWRSWAASQKWTSMSPYPYQNGNFLTTLRDARFRIKRNTVYTLLVRFL